MQDKADVIKEQNENMLNVERLHLESQASNAHIAAKVNAIRLSEEKSEKSGPKTESRRSHI